MGSLMKPQSDIFLSHCSADKDFVRKLAADIETETFEGRHLKTWVDEAEIRPGQSIVKLINQGLEASRFIGLVMTPAYFQSESGWTDAEWHSALHVDPDNRRVLIIPMLAADCPYIPVLLRHLLRIDLRGGKYPQGLDILTRILRNEPLPRPTPYRGQLLNPMGMIDRATLIAERAVPQADPDAVSEHLYCNLLPVQSLPQHVYTASIAKGLRKLRKDGTGVLPSKNEIKEKIRQVQEENNVKTPLVPAFRIVGDRIITFHDLESPEGLLASVVEDDVEPLPTVNLVIDEDDRKIVVSLLNMAISRHAHRIGLVADETKNWRYFFPPKENSPNIITWVPLKVRASRTVAKPCAKDGQVQFWRHQGAYLKVLFLGNRFYLHITPTWVFTEDGYRVKGGPKIGRLVIKWTGPERNLHLLYHIRFWTSILRRGAGPISIKAGDQRMEVSPIPAFVEQVYGIAYDQKNLLGLLDQEAPLIAGTEDELADLAAEEEFNQPEGVLDQDELIDEAVEEIEETESDEVE